MENSWLFDTDILLNQNSIDPKVRNASERLYRYNKPAALSSFSKVEFKGNYIQSLVLLRTKTKDSNSLEEVYLRIKNNVSAYNKGRKTDLMLAELIRIIGGLDFAIKSSWLILQSCIIAEIDARIRFEWDRIDKAFQISNSFNCTRANEPPQTKNNEWDTSIPRCTTNNTLCTINKFVLKYKQNLVKFLAEYTATPEERKTEELMRIYEVIENAFPWQGKTCRQVGDFLIGLQSKNHKELISSNKKEHLVMRFLLEYNYKEFPISEHKTK
jgi:hypothetical protein